MNLTNQKNSNYRSIIFILSVMVCTSLWSGTTVIQYGDDMVYDCEMTRWYDNGYRYFSNPDMISSNLTYFSSNQRWERYYYKFPVPEFIYQNSIDSASFKVFKIEMDEYSDEDFILTINHLIEDMNSYYEQFNGNLQAPNRGELNYDTTIAYVSDYVGWIEFDITELMSLWSNYEIENYGLVIRMLHEEFPTQQRIAISQSTSSPEFRPIVEINGENIPDTLLTSAQLGTHSTLGQSKQLRIQSFPNPFNSSVMINYEIIEAGEVDLTIYDILGQQVKKIVTQGFQHPGMYSVHWNGRNDKEHFVDTGVYICSLTTGVNQKSIKILLVK